MSGDESDLAAEVADLRAELEALKRAFMTEAAERKLTVADRPLIVAEAVEAATVALGERREQRQVSDTETGPE